jgi:DNA-binding transcriptional ArsR family regulator
MGITKTNLFTEEQNAIATLAKALGHPARVAILQHLIKSKACINSDLVNELGLAQATISQHLKELKNLGIIQGTIEGTSMNYCIHSKNWLVIKDTFNHLFDQHACCESDSCC